MYAYYVWSDHIDAEADETVAHLIWHAARRMSVEEHALYLQGSGLTPEQAMAKARAARSGPHPICHYEYAIQGRSRDAVIAEAERRWVRGGSTCLVGPDEDRTPYHKEQDF